MLGCSLLGQKKYADAEPLLKEGYDGMKRREETIPPEAIVRLTEALECRAALRRHRQRRRNRLRRERVGRPQSGS